MERRLYIQRSLFVIVFCDLLRTLEGYVVRGNLRNLQTLGALQKSFDGKHLHPGVVLAYYLRAVKPGGLGFGCDVGTVAGRLKVH